MRLTLFDRIRDAVQTAICFVVFFSGVAEYLAMTSLAPAVLLYFSVTVVFSVIYGEPDWLNQVGLAMLLWWTYALIGLYLILGDGDDEYNFRV